MPGCFCGYAIIHVKVDGIALYISLWCVSLIFLGDTALVIKCSGSHLFSTILLKHVPKYRLYYQRRRHCLYQCT